ncbi:MAG: DUF4203 domain-containing protein [Limisphaerales bacterium]
MQWVNILVGLALLLFGRRLFWLFVGGVGFIVGFELAGQALQGQPEWMILLIAVIVGLLGIVAAIFLQRLVVGIAGFFAGGYCLSTLAMTALHLTQQSAQWIAFIIGGVLGAVLTVMLLDPALILMSSLAGATAVSQSVPLDPSARGLVFIGLLVLGIIVQTVQYASVRKSRQLQQNE